MVAGFWVPELVGVGTISVAFAGTLILSGILYRLWDKGGHELSFLQISAGSAWLIGWGLVDGMSVLTSGTMPFFSGWTAAAVVAGVGQVLAGSLAYLIPVLKGSPFVANREIFGAHRWLPLLTVNGAALCLGFGVPAVAFASLSLWACDFGIRLARVAMGRFNDGSGSVSRDSGPQSGSP